MGGQRMQFQVLVDPDKLIAKGVTLHEVHEAVAQSNVNVTGGYLDEGPNELLVRSLGRVKTVEDLERSAREHTRRRWLWLHLVRSAAAPYVLLAFLVVVGFAIRRWRLRRRLAELDEFEP